MAKRKGSNKMTYRPLKNSNMIGAGKKESIPEILANGPKAKPEGQNFKDYVAAERQQGKQQKTRTEITKERKIALDQKREQAKSQSQPSKEPEKGKNTPAKPRN